MTNRYFRSLCIGLLALALPAGLVTIDVGRLTMTPTVYAQSEANVVEVTLVEYEIQMPTTL